MHPRCFWLEYIRWFHNRFVKILDMSILTRTVSGPSLSLKLNGSLKSVISFKRSLQSTSTDSTQATRHLDSENQEEDHG